MGVAAHIKAAAPGGPRFDASQSSDERSSILNGIWLCQTCSRLIDSDPLRFPESILYAWKSQCEAQTLAELDGLMAPRSPPEVLRALVEELLDEAFDILAGDANAIRVTWPAQTPSMLERARRTLARAATLSPDNQRLPLLQAIYQVAVGFPDKALEMLDAAALAGPYVSDLRARCLTALGRKGETIALMQAVIDSGTATPATYFNMGLAQAEVDADQATRSFETAVAMDPDYAEAHRNLYQLLKSSGRHAEAMGHLDIAFGIKPTEPRIAFNVVRECIDAGQTSRAQEVAEAALAQQPQDADLWALCGEIFGRIRDYSEASRCLTRALTIDRINELALQNKLVLLMETQDEAGLRDYVANFPLDEESLPKELREFARLAREDLAALPTTNGASSAVTEEGLMAFLLAQARDVKGTFVVPRFAWCNLAYPSSEDGFTSHGVALIVALTSKADELPLAASRLRADAGLLPMECIAQRTRDVPDEFGEIAAKLGSVMYEGLFACPLIDGIVEIDFARRRTEMELLQVKGRESVLQPASRPDLLRLAVREFPYLAPLVVPPRAVEGAPKTTEPAGEVE